MTSFGIFDSKCPKDLSSDSLVTLDTIPVVSRCSSPILYSSRSSNPTDDYIPTPSLNTTIVSPSPSRKRSRSAAPPSALSVLMDSVEKTLIEVETLIKQKKAKTCGDSSDNNNNNHNGTSSHLSEMCSISLPMVDDTANGLLHLYCQKPSLTSIDMFGMIVRHFPDAIKTRTKIERGSSSEQPRSFWNRQNDRCEPYTLPINIALHNNASAKIVDLLASACPEVLNLQDGRNGACSLAIALQTQHVDISIVDLLLHANPKCAEVADKRFNFPLHVACSKGLSLEVVKSLYQLYPDALSKNNMNGETPLVIAQRNFSCSEEVLDFLESNAFREC